MTVVEHIPALHDLLDAARSVEAVSATSHLIRIEMKVRGNQAPGTS